MQVQNTPNGEAAYPGFRKALKKFFQQKITPGELNRYSDFVSDTSYNEAIQLGVKKGGGTSV